MLTNAPIHPHCFATVFYNDTSGGTRARRTFQLDIAMARLFVSRMLTLTSLPIFVLHVSAMIASSSRGRALTGTPTH